MEKPAEVKTPTRVTAYGLTLRSPCKSCFIHLLGIPKNKNVFCLECKVRVEYDKMISSGSFTYPFISSETREKIGMI